MQYGNSGISKNDGICITSIFFMLMIGGVHLAVLRIT